MSVFQSGNVTIRRGLIDGNNSPSGVGVMFEASNGATGGLCEDVDTVRMGNGCFSGYPAYDVTFSRTRARDNTCTDQGRGARLVGLPDPGFTTLEPVLRGVLAPGRIHPHPADAGGLHPPSADRERLLLGGPVRECNGLLRSSRSELRQSHRSGPCDRGLRSHVINDLTFTVSDLPPGKPGISLYGPSQTQIPFGNGFLCVGGAVIRILPVQYSTSTGTVDYAVDLTLPPFSSGPGQMTPGSTWNFQFWYRDPGGAPSTFNVSNALQIVFAP